MKKNKYIDKEEKELIESFSSLDKNSLKKPSDKLNRSFKKAARDYLKHEAKMNIRIDPHELKLIKEYAAHEGLKYQSFVKSVVHKYITGQLVEKRSK